LKLKLLLGSSQNIEGTPGLHAQESESLPFTGRRVYHEYSFP
jgi:hypothetical protein